jgi:hypothetical protein
MGTTSASAHIQWRGTSEAAAKAISRAYTGLGYKRARKPPADGGKRVILLTRPGEHFVSIFDSTNADLDSGELKDAALAASRLLRAGAVFTSLYDSDSYEFIVFSNGRQVDLLMSEVESYTGPMKRLSARSRVTQWTRIFARPLTADQIEQAAGRQTVFANATLSSLCNLIGLPADRPQMHYKDFADEPPTGIAELYFTKTADTHPAATDGAPDGAIILRNYFDPDNSRKLLVYPAGWPMPPRREEILTWLMLSEGAGFTGGTARITVTGPDGLVFAKGFINGAKFHHGQIVGGYELPSDAALEVAQAYLEQKRFDLIPTGPEAPPESSPKSSAESHKVHHYTAEYPNLWVPQMTPQRTTQILLVFQLHISAAAPGEWEVTATLQPQSDTGFTHTLPSARVAVVERTWVPVVSGHNPKAAYDTADIPEHPLPDHILDILVQRYGHGPFRQMQPAEARARLESDQEQGRPREFANWAHDLKYRQQHVPQDCRLNYPAIASNVAILPDDGQAALDVCRSYLEDCLRPLRHKAGELRLRAERQMTETAHVGKITKVWPLSVALHDKTWAKLFDAASEYQAVVIDIVPDGSEIPVAGMGLNATLRTRKAAAPAGASPEAEWDSYDNHMLALTLGRMRGRAVPAGAPGSTLHLYNWVTNHPTCHQYLETSLGGMRQQLDALAAAHAPLQAWHGTSTWIPKFDQASSFEDTVYEDQTLLNFFRGVLHARPLGLKDRRMTAAWCSQVLRMVTPHMWLCANLAAQLDQATLRRAAIVSDINGSHRIEKRPECAMDDFELTLLPVLPIESARIRLMR